MKEKILIVEDEFIVANDLKIMLTRAGFQVTGIAASVVQARKLMADKRPDWVLLDIMLKGSLTGIDLAWELREQGVPFLYISANTNQSTLEAVKETEPYGFMVKPFREKDLLVMLDIAQYRFGIEQDSRVIPSTSNNNQGIFDGIVGQSEALREIMRKISIVAPTDTSVLILGESGTGKERIAHAVHENSPRKDKPIVVVNCAALPSTLVESELFGYEKGAFTGANARKLGKFEQADGGTLFLDEIGELPLEAQVKLLRVLQEKEIERIGGEHTVKVNVRIVAATNRKLEQEVAEGRFRLDLYYRLNVFPVELTPLRERKDDLELLANHFIAKYAKRSNKHVNGITAEALKQLTAYKWPGNIRELEHLIERNILFAQGDKIEHFDIPEAISQQVTDTKQEQPNGPLRSMEDMEREHIINALKQCGGKVFGSGGAAEILKINPTTLYTKMKKLGIKQEYF